MSDGHLVMWTIYRNPSDHPDWIVARAFVIKDGRAEPDHRVLKNRSLESMRRLMRDWGLTCLQREPEDDPVIVETWL